MRYLLCRPRGGLNDTLCEIERCWAYAEKYNRTLIIDTTRSGLHDNFWRYFVPVNPRINILPLDELASGRTFPTQVTGVTGPDFAYESVYSPTVHNFVEKNSRQRLTFDDTRDHTSECLIHEQCWYGEFRSPNIFNRIQLRDDVANEVALRLNKLPKEYVAVHIRNTDYKTDVELYFNSIKNDLLYENVLVCSDDSSAINFFRDSLKHSITYQLSNFSNPTREPLHEKQRSEQIELNLQLLTDLIGLAKAKIIFSSPISNSPRESGFSMLAKALKQKMSVSVRYWG